MPKVDNVNGGKINTKFGIKTNREKKPPPISKTVVNKQKLYAICGFYFEIY